MKKILTFLILALSAQFVLAQVTLRPQVGINSSSIEGNFENLNFKNRSGYQLGFDLMIGNRLYVQPGLQYEFVRNTLETPGSEADFKVGRVRIPVMIGYKLLGKSGLLNVRLFTGPNMSFVTSVDDEGSQFGIDKEDFKSAAFGWNAGAGLDLLFLFADLGYQFGLSEVFDELNIQGIEGADSKNNLFYLNGGIRIRFGGR